MIAVVTAVLLMTSWLTGQGASVPPEPPIPPAPPAGLPDPPDSPEPDPPKTGPSPEPPSALQAAATSNNASSEIGEFAGGSRKRGFLWVCTEEAPFFGL